MTVEDLQEELKDLLSTIGILQIHVDRDSNVYDALGVAYDALRNAIADDAEQ